jgi:catechol 2,3-dioxygenase-like lactoylglutathione lyase family enzyme
MAGIGYVTIGTNNFDRALEFYDALIGEMGGKRLMPTPVGQMYRLASGPMFMVAKPYNQEPATIGNGSMLAFSVDSVEDVARLHAKALSLGGVCEGPPGPRGAFGEFAYFRDLDGNKLAVFRSARA